MRRTIKLMLPPNGILIETIELYNEVCNQVLKIAYQAHTFNKTKVHHLTYYGIRQKYPMLPSNMVQCLRNQACDILRRANFECLPKKKIFGAIRYNQRTFKPYLKKGIVSLSTMHGRIQVTINIPKYFEKYLNWQVRGAMLSYDIHIQKLRLHMTVEREDLPELETSTVLGVDSGILNHAVLSNNMFFTSNHIRNVKGRYQYLRQKLQAKGTSSAMRLLRKRSGREKRFMADVNHRIAKLIVNQPFTAIGLEKLEVKRAKKNGKCFNRKLGNWSWCQLQIFIEYKAEALGKTVVYVNPAYTSKICSRCGQKGTRKGLTLKCKHCGFELNADLNASRNIAYLAKCELGRLNVNQPNAMSQASQLKMRQFANH